MSKNKDDGLVPVCSRTEKDTLSKAGKSEERILAKIEKEMEKECRRIIFAFDATGSRERSWKEAIPRQARIVKEAMEYGNIIIKIVVYRDREANPDDYIEESEWSNDTVYLQKFMKGVICQGGGGNLGESVDVALEVALKEEPAINGMMLVGDEPVLPSKRSDAYQYSKKLGERKIPVFAFQEEEDQQAEKDFKTIAKNSGGVYEHFTEDCVRVAVIYIVGGKAALKEFLLLNESKSSNKKLDDKSINLAKRLLGPKKEDK